MLTLLLGGKRPGGQREQAEHGEIENQKYFSLAAANYRALKKRRKKNDQIRKTNRDGLGCEGGVSVDAIGKLSEGARWKTTAATAIESGATAACTWVGSNAAEATA